MYIPDQNRIYEFAIPIRYRKTVKNMEAAVPFIQKKVVPVIKMLKEEFSIKWYGILVHGRDGGITWTKKGKDYHYHIRVELPSLIPVERLTPYAHAKEYDLLCIDEIVKLVETALPDYCVGFRKQEITGTEGFDNSRFVVNDIFIPSGLLGITSELVYELCSVHKMGELNPHHILQTLHYICNPLRILENPPSPFTKREFSKRYGYTGGLDYFFIGRTYRTSKKEGKTYFNWKRFRNGANTEQHEL